MTSGQVSSSPRNGINAFLPWILGIVALGVYLATLNRWVSLLSLPQATNIAGFNWEPNFGQPAYFLATYPLRWLPTATVPIALNLFSAICAALVLAQLARSVIILPHDRTQDQRDRETDAFAQLSIPLAWLPPALAVIACGLQLTFWEHSTNGTPDMFDLLLFAYVIRSLLEYRLDERESRLFRAAFVQGIGMANNYAMIGFFPLFIAALIWIRGFSFFRVRFLSRMLLWGLVGLSLYLLIPILNGLSKEGAPGAWESLRVYLSSQRSVLAYVVFSKSKLIHGPRMDDSDPLWMLAVTSLLPLLLLAIRWPSHFGDTSRVGTLLAKWIFHIAHAFLLLLCLWVCFDAPISPRHIMTKNGWQAVLTLLPFYYLGALAIGYFAGYFLLVFRPLAIRNRRNAPLLTGVHRLATTVILGLLVVLTGGLFYRNLPSVRLTNGTMMRGFMAAITEGFPQRGVVVSDDRRLLELTQLFLAKSGRKNDFLPVDTDAWHTVAYHNFMGRQFPGRWPEDNKALKQIESLDEEHMASSVIKLSKTSDIVYLHPSFGLFFEHFVAEPHFAVQQLKPYPTNSIVVSTVSKKCVSDNEAFWTRLESDGLRPILTSIARRSKKGGLLDKLFVKAHLTPEENSEAKTLGMMYSRALDYWAVELQKANEWEYAAARLELALKLNPDNAAAKANLKYNTNFRAGNPGSLDLSKPIDELFNNYRTWDQAVRDNGPIDEPNIVCGQAYFFLRNRNFRQAAQYFDRLRNLFPTDVLSRLWLANLHLSYRYPEEALELVNEIRTLQNAAAIEVTNAVDLLSIEASAYFEKNEPTKAMSVIESQLKRHTNNSQVIVAAVKLYSDNGHLADAYALLDHHIKKAPDDPLLLINKGVLLMGETNYSEAIQLFGQVLSTYTNMPTARLYRAIAYAKTGEINKAKEDYEVILQSNPNLREALFGLHDISFDQKDYAMALEYGKRYLSNAIPIAPETKLVWNRVKTMQDEAPEKGNLKDKKAKSSTP